MMKEPCEEVKRVEQRYEKSIDNYEKIINNMERRYREVLDKIKVEITNLDYIDEDKYEGTNMSPMIDREDALEIIDKYKERYVENVE